MPCPELREDLGRGRACGPVGRLTGSVQGTREGRRNVAHWAWQEVREAGGRGVSLGSSTVIWAAGRRCLH